jgi:hypothetical protein
MSDDLLNQLDEAKAPEPEPSPQPELAPAPEPATAAPAVDPAPEPTAAGAAPEPAPLTVEQLEARLATLEQERQAERQGFVRTLSELRTQLRQHGPVATPAIAAAPAPQGAPPAAQPGAKPGRIPIEIDENGQPYVKPEALTQYVSQSPAPQDPAAAYVARVESARLSIVLEDPAENAKPMARLVEGFQYLDGLVQQAQVETQVTLHPTGDVMADLERVCAFIESNGLLPKFQAAYPDIATSMEDVEALVTAAVTVSPGRMRKVLGRYKARQASATPAQAADSDPAPVIGRVPAEKPRPMASRGRAPREADTSSTRLTELQAKPVLQWTDAEAKEYKRLMGELAEKELSAAS